jgi:hypothetical protein
VTCRSISSDHGVDLNLHRRDVGHSIDRKMLETDDPDRREDRRQDDDQPAVEDRESEHPIQE